MSRPLAALVFGAALALGSIGEALAQVGNIGGTILPSAARTAVQINSADQINLARSGVHVAINVSVYVSGSYTPKIQAKDPVSQQYYDVLIGAPISATGITILKVAPRITPLANAAANDFLPRVWRVQLNGAGGQSMTFSVGMNLNQ